MRLILKRIHSKSWKIKTWPRTIVLKWTDSGAMNSRLDRVQLNWWTQLDIDELEALWGFYSEVGRLKSMKKKVRDAESRLNGSNICLIRVPKVKSRRNREAIWRNNGQEFFALKKMRVFKIKSKIRGIEINPYLA